MWRYICEGLHAAQSMQLLNVCSLYAAMCGDTEASETIWIRKIPCIMTLHVGSGHVQSLICIICLMMLTSCKYLTTSATW